MSPDLDGYDLVPAPRVTHRLIPSQFPPIDAFEAAASAEDLDAVFELEGWTNDRLSAPRLAQLDRDERVYGRPNASIVMAAFLHGSPTGLRFTGPELGAWYASTDLATAMLEIANGLRREIAASALGRITQTYRGYTARLEGHYVDIMGRHPELQDPDPASYPASQAFGRQVRGMGAAGIRYESARHAAHQNWVCFRPSAVQDVTQVDHFELDVPRTGRVVARRLS